MLYSPGQYSRGISPVRASTPRRRSARSTMPAIVRKRSCVPDHVSCAGPAHANAIVFSWKTAARPPASRWTASKPPA